MATARNGIQVTCSKGKAPAVRLGQKAKVNLLVSLVLRYDPSLLQVAKRLGPEIPVGGFVGHDHPGCLFIKTPERAVGIPL